MLAATVMFLTRPAESVKGVSERKSTDKHSFELILLSGFLALVIPVTEWAHLESWVEASGSGVITAAFLAMMVRNLAFRVWSIVTLGRFATAKVQMWIVTG